MNYVISLYVIYLLMVAGVIAVAGWQIYQAGKPFVRMIFSGDRQKADWISGLLLTGYYLVCTGYSFTVLGSLPAVAGLPSMIGVLSTWVGRLILILSVLHYCNMMMFSLWKRYHKA